MERYKIVAYKGKRRKCHSERCYTQTVLMIENKQHASKTFALFILLLGFEHTKYHLKIEVYNKEFSQLLQSCSTQNCKPKLDEALSMKKATWSHIIEI